MGTSQQKFREILFQLIYSSDFSGSQEEETIGLLMKEHAVPKKTLYIAQEQHRALQEVQQEIDTLIATTSEAYVFSRIPRVERNILRLAVYELRFLPELPYKVVIAEALRLSRKFATLQGATFVNAILDAIYNGSSSAVLLGAEAKTPEIQ